LATTSRTVSHPSRAATTASVRPNARRRRASGETNRARFGTGCSGTASMSTPSRTRAITARVVAQSATGSRTLPRTPCDAASFPP